MHHCSPHPPGCRATSSAALDPHQQENRMSKGMDQKKTQKKKPEKSLLEKRAAKKEKKGK